MLRKMKNNKYIKILGYLVGLLSFYYIYVSISRSGLSWSKLNDSIQASDYWLLLISLVLYIIIMLIGGGIWSWLVHVFSPESEQKIDKVVLVHAKSNLAKYLPGNFMHFVGRNVLGSNLGYKHSSLILATMFELMYSIFFGVVIVLLLNFLNLTQINFIGMLNVNIDGYLFEISIIVLVIMLLLLFKNKIISFVNNYELIKQIKKTFAKGFIIYTIAYMILGFCNFFIFIALTDTNVTYLDYFNILVVYLISWLFGLIIPGLPGGLGVREAIYISILSPVYGLYTITLLALMLRVINIIGDILYFIISVSFIKNKKLENSSQ